VRRKIIGYAKLGRSMPLQLANCGSLGGDHEMVPTLKLLAERHPDVDFLLVGRNSGEEPTDVGLPENVLNPWRTWAPILRQRLNADGLNYSNLTIDDHLRVRQLMVDLTRDTFASLDEIVMWIGQHGTSNSPLPSIRDRATLTKPYDWATLYAGYLLHNVNAWRDVDPIAREEVLLNSDARNYVKFRDAAWAWCHPVLSQYTFTSTAKHERYGRGDELLAAFPAKSYDGIWESRVRNVYARLEISSLVPGTPFGDTLRFDDTWDGRDAFGIVVNETKREVAPQRSRLRALQEYVLPLEPAWVHGHWSEASRRILNREIEPLPLADYPGTMHTVHSTLTTPASGSGWATAKPWEAFALGVVCFFHPRYDDQDHVLNDAPTELHDFLRVKSPKELARRVHMVHADREVWTWAVTLQRRHFEDAIAALDYLKIIESRLGL